MNGPLGPRGAREQASAPEENAGGRARGQEGRRRRRGWGWGESWGGGRSDPATVGARWGDSRTSRLGGQQQPGLGARLWEARQPAETGIPAQPLTAAVARLCMLGAAAALLLPPDAPDPRPGFSGGCAARDEEPPSASGWLLPLR